MGRWQPAGLTEGHGATDDKTHGSSGSRAAPHDVVARSTSLARFKGCGINIRKQHPCGPFVVDFYCPAARLIIEIDGIVHEMGDRPERDAKRTQWLQRQGYEVLHIPPAEVLADVDATAESIVAACRARGA
jgi:very-short-patch-repair endonuclease